MAKLRSDPIVQADLIEYLESESDFAFELQCLELMTQLQFECDHGGPYRDPITNKIREFDIRASKSFQVLHASLAIECKNLKQNSPLMVMCVPRNRKESYHQVVFAASDAVHQSVWGGHSILATRRFKIEGQGRAYIEQGLVGKSCSRVGRAQAQPNSIIPEESEIYERWSQALNSASDLWAAVTSLGVKRKVATVSVVIPILVVPNETLWQVNFKTDGSRACDPFKTDRCSYFVNYTDERMPGYVITHLEIMTMNGLKAFAQSVFAKNGEWFDEGSLDIAVNAAMTGWR